MKNLQGSRPSLSVTNSILGTICGEEDDGLLGISTYNGPKGHEVESSCRSMFGWIKKKRSILFLPLLSYLTAVIGMVMSYMEMRKLWTLQN